MGKLFMSAAVVLLCNIMGITFASASAIDTILHHFADGSIKNDGANPCGNITLSHDGKTLYGTTVQGGSAGNGTVFSIPAAGGTPTILHHFADGSIKNDGANPCGNITLSHDGKTLYGTTTRGGLAGGGIIFSIPAAGGTPTILHHFGDGSVPNDGADPLPGLTLSGDGATLYGATYIGGLAGRGIIFSIPAAGGTPTILHHFGDGSVKNDGSRPGSGLTLSGDGMTLYGTTCEGGSIGNGTIFSIPAAGGTPTILHHFGDGSVTNDGVNPYTTSLTLSLDGMTLYGMTYEGGLAGGGIIFSIPAAGGTPTILHQFWDGGVLNDGVNPYGSLALSHNGKTLYGVTWGGGSVGNGIIFSIPAAGGTPTILHDFGDVSVSNDGTNPAGGLALSADGMTLYGSTYAGGSAGKGTVFSGNLNPCAYTLFPNVTTKWFTNVGGSMTFTVTGKGPEGVSCTPPSLVASDSWIVLRLTSPFSKNKGTVRVAVQPNATHSGRNGSASIGGDTVHIGQTGELCTVTFSSPSGTFSGAGGKGDFTITATPSDCAWTAATSVSWIHITGGASGTGTGFVEYTVDPGTAYGNERTTVITVTVENKKKTYPVKQIKDLPIPI